MKLKNLLFSFMLCMLIGHNAANAVTKTWAGGTSSVSWAGGTWSPAGAPVAGDDVIFNTNATITNVPTINALNSLTLSGGVTVTLTGNGQVISIGAGGLNIPSGNTLKMLLNTQLKAGTGFNATGAGSLFTAATSTALPAGTSGANVIYPFDIILNAGGAQTLPGYATYTNLTVNLPTSTTITKLGTGSVITGILTLTSGILDCVGNTFTMSPTASLAAGSGSQSSYIYMSSASGALVRRCPQATATLFPIGTATTYTPLTITNTSGTSDITTKLKTSFTRAPLVAANCVNLEWSVLGSSATTADLSFQFNTSNFGTGYTVSGSELGNNTTAYSRVATGFVTGSSNPYTYSVTGLTIPTTAANYYVIGNYGAIIAATAPNTAPTITSITPADGQLLVAFTAPKSNGGADITDYKYSINGGTNYISVGSTSSPFTISGLTNGTAYTVLLKGVNSVGDGTASTGVSGTPVGGALIAPTISFATPTSVIKNYGDPAFTNSASSNSAGALNYSSGTPDVATVDASSGQVTIVAAGSTVITVSQAANGIYDVGSKTYTLTVAPKSLSISGLPTTKPYDGTTTASVTGTAVLSAAEAKGVGSTSDGLPYTGDDVSVNSTATAGTFSSKDAGSRTITYTGLSLSGAQAANYTIGTTAGTITPLALSATPSGGQKNYSGTLAAGTITATLSGLVGTETLGVTAVGTFTDVSAGQGKTVNITYTLADGTNGGKAANYSLAPGTMTANISKKPLTQVVTSISSKIYDGTTTTGTVNLGALSGFVNGETVTAAVNTSTYTDANVGTGKTATITYTLGNGTNGGLASNYYLANNTTATGDITAISLPITGSGQVSIGNSSLLPGTDLSVADGVELIVDNSTTVRSLTVVPGAKVTLNSATPLTATNGIILQSSLTATATLKDNYSTPTITATVQQYLPQGRNWYVSVPTSTGNTSNFIGGGLATSVSHWNEVGDGTTGAWVNDYTGAMTPGKGYVAVSANGSGSGTNNISYSALLNSGNIPVTLTRTGTGSFAGYNLIANPYPSYVNPMAALNALNVEKTIWYRTKGSTYKFETVNTTTGVGTDAAQSGHAVTGYIPPFQAFWVRTNTTGEELVFTNAMREHANPVVGETTIATTTMKVRKQDLNSIVRIRINGNGGTDEAVLYFNADASNAYDNFDSRKMFESVAATTPEIYTQIGVEKLVINGMQAVPYNIELPLGFVAKQAGDYSIAVDEMKNFETGTRIVLIDKNVPNTEKELTADVTYQFSSQVTVPSTDRFSLVFRSPSNSTSLKEVTKLNAQVYVNAVNQIAILAPVGSNYVIYNALGQNINDGLTSSNTQIINMKPQSGMYVVRVSENGKELTTKVFIK